MKLLIKTTVRLAGLLIVFTVLSSALSVIADHFGADNPESMPLASYEHEYIGGESVTIFGQRIGLAGLSRFCDDTWQLIDKAGALLPHDLRKSAAGVLKMIGEGTRSIIQFLVSPSS